MLSGVRAPHTDPLNPLPCRIPGGAANGGPLQVVLTQEKLEELTLELWRRCRLPLDQVRGGEGGCGIVDQGGGA